MNLATISIYWFLFPLIVAICLVYAASRHEAWPRIWKYAARVAVTITVLMVLATVLLTCINGCV